jgi:hypothetical protein
MVSITTFGTPLDVTAQELRIESIFPADEATRRLLRETAETNRRSKNGSLRNCQ